jgi:hypothetical protein
VGPILVAIVSVSLRLAGQSGAADFLAVGAIAALTLGLQRSTSLQAAARVVHSCNTLPPASVGSSVIAR